MKSAFLDAGFRPLFLAAGAWSAIAVAIWLAALSGAIEIPSALDSSSRINLLFSDVVLPGGMSGPELAAETLRRRPGIAVLHTSGYTENAAIHQGRLDNGIELLNKPFKKADFAQMGAPPSINRNCERSPPMV